MATKEERKKIAEKAYPAPNTPEHKCIQEIVNIMFKAYPDMASRRVVACNVCVNNFAEFMGLFEKARHRKVKSTLYYSFTSLFNTKSTFLGFPLLGILINLDVIEVRNVDGSKPIAQIKVKPLMGGPQFTAAMLHSGAKMWADPNP